MMRESVLYYTPAATPATAKLKGILVQMGVRIRNIAPGQALQTIGFLAGVEGFPETNLPEGTEIPAIDEEVLVMHQFTSGRIDTLLAAMRRAGVPKIRLKAVTTESNCPWTFYKLYEELKEEHEQMTKQAENGGQEHV